MKNGKRLLCALMAGALLFTTACGAKENAGAKNTGTVQKGRYVEKEVTPTAGEEELLGVKQTSDGKLVAFSKGLKVRYDSADGGKTWEEKPGPGKDKPELESAANFSLSADGAIYTMLRPGYGEQKEPVENPMLKILPDGTIEPLKIKEFEDLKAEGKNPQMQYLVALPQNRLLVSFAYDMGSNAQPAEKASNEETTTSETLGKETPQSTGTSEAAGEQQKEDEKQEEESHVGSYQSKTFICNTENLTVVKELEQFMGNMMAADEKNLYLGQYDNSIAVLDLASCEITKTIKEDNGSGEWDFNRTLAADKEGTLFVASQKGIGCIDGNGKVEELFGSGAYAFSNPTYYLNGMIALQEKAFLLELVQMSGSSYSAKLFRYEYDENAILDPNKTLNVWAYQDNPTVRMALSEFMKKYPDGNVNFEVGTTGENAQNGADAIKNLNTRILAGDGPDVIILDGCPAQSYADKGMLMDLTGKLDTSGLYEPIAQAFKSEKGQFFIPARFKIPTVFGAEQALKNATTLNTLAEAVKNGPVAPEVTPGSEDGWKALPENERPVVSFDNTKELFNLLWASSSSKVVNKEGVDKESLRTFLQDMKTISDKLNLAAKAEDEQSGTMGIGINGVTAMISGSPIAYSSQRALLGAATLEYIFSGFIFENSQAIKAGTAEKPLYKSFPGLSEGSWVPQTLASVNAATKKPELAVEFLQTLLSDTVQGVTTVGYPVSKAGAQQQITSLDSSLRGNEPNSAGFNFDMDSFVSQMKTPVLENSMLSEKFYGVAKDYCAGKLELEAALEKAEAEVKTYLAEQA